MKKIYNAPEMTVVKIQPASMIALSNAGNAKANGITTADSRSYDIWDDED